MDLRSMDWIMAVVLVDRIEVGVRPLQTMMTEAVAGT